MKRYVFFFVHIIFFFMMLTQFSGCASSKHTLRATSPDSEIVEAEGMAPVVNNDINGARQTSLNEAMKNALGLVVGVYVSQEALVSKAILIEDNITSQTEGYIEKYDVLKEWRETDFYKTRIKAVIRKEDLAAKLKALELEPKKLGNPVVKFNIEEFIDGQPSSTRFAENELKRKFIEKGFTVSDSDISDILLSGKAESNFNTNSGMAGMVSYRASLSLSVVKTVSKDVISTVSETMGGLDATNEAAAKASILNSAIKASQNLPDTVLKFMKERSVVQLTLSNVENINILNDSLRSFRALIEVRDCKVRSYANGIALIEADLKKGTSSDLAKRLEQMTSIKLKVNNVSAYAIEIVIIK